MLLPYALVSNMPSRRAVSVLGGLSNHAWPKSDVPIVGSPDRSAKACFQRVFPTEGSAAEVSRPGDSEESRYDPRGCAPMESVLQRSAGARSGPHSPSLDKSAASDRGL